MIFVALILFIAAVAVVAFLARKSRSTFVQGRDCLPLEQIHAESGTDVSFSLFHGLFHVLGNGLGVSPGQLRPSDTFAALFQVDSWQLGDAQDDLERFLREQTTKKPPEVRTIYDLLQWLSLEEGERCPAR